MKINKTLIFTATYNEAENIAKLIAQIISLKLDVDICIIDDNSPDKTYDKIRIFKKKFKNIKLIIREKKLGLDTAHKFAFNYAKENNYEKLITMDADLSHDPRDIPIFINLLDKYPFVIGSRYIKGGKNEMTLFRYLLSYFGNLFIKKIFGIQCSEFTTSYRGFNLIKLNNFDLSIIKSKGYSFFMETLYRINESRHDIKEIPIIFKNRIKGKSKIPKIEIFRTLKNVFLLFLKK